MEKFIFVHWFVQVKGQKTTVKKKTTYFLKNYVPSLFTVFENVLETIFFYRSVFRCKVLNLLYFICFKFKS